MVRAMTTGVDPIRSELLADASVVTSVVDIAGARHEVLPPRFTGGDLLFRSPSRAASP